MQWIKCSDKLPQDQDECLVCFKCSPNVAYELSVFQTGKFHSWYAFNEIKNVTHWMSLPEPPKDE